MQSKKITTRRKRLRVKMFVSWEEVRGLACQGQGICFSLKTFELYFFPKSHCYILKIVIKIQYPLKTVFLIFQGFRTTGLLHRWEDLILAHLLCKIIWDYLLFYNIALVNLEKQERITCFRKSKFGFKGADGWRNLRMRAGSPLLPHVLVLKW